LANAVSKTENATAWNARSQAANLGDEVPPVVVAQPLSAGQRVGAVLGEPAFHVERVVLLGPEHAGERLPADVPVVRRQRAGEHVVPELVGLRGATAEHLVEVGERVGRRAVGQPQPYRRAAAGRYREDVVQGRLGTHTRRVDRRPVTVHDRAVDAVLDVGSVVRGTEHQLVVGFVAGHQ